MKPFIIGVAGGSGSGKSTVTEQLYNSLGKDNITVVFQDNYYLDRSHLTSSEREKINFDHPDALDWALMKKHIDDLYHGLPIQMPMYDFSTHTRRSETQTLTPSKIIVVEGLFALYDEEIRSKMQLRIFVDTAADIRLLRRLKRDIVERGRTIDSVFEQYSKFVRPMYKKFIEPTKRFAHIIIPHGSNKAALEMIVSRTQSILKGETIQLFDDMSMFDEE